MRSGVFISILILVGTSYGLFRLFTSKKETVFQANLIAVDTAKVSAVLVSNNPYHPSELSFFRENQAWIISTEQIPIKADPAQIQELLQKVRAVKTNKVIAKDRKSWKIYSVDNTQGIRVRLYAEKTLLEDFVVGKSEVDPQTQTPISYLRFTGENEVYAVEGNIGAAFSQNFTNARSRLILQIAPSLEITELEYQLPDTTWQFTQTPEGWKSGAWRLDSLTMLRYLQGLRQISGDRFADDFDEVQGSKYLYQILTIHVKEVEEPFVLTCYRDTTAQMPFVIHSSQNPEAFFASDSVGIYHNIFKNVNNFKSQIPTVGSEVH